MSYRRLTPAEVRAIVARYRAFLAQFNGTAEKIVEEQGAQLLDVFIERVRGITGVSQSDRLRLRRELRDAISDAGLATAQATSGMLPQLGALGAARTGAALAAQAADAYSAARILEHFDRIERAIAGRTFMQLPPHYRARWVQAWNDGIGQRWEPVARQIEREVLLAARTGEATNTVADRLTEGLSRLRERAGSTPSGAVHPEQPIRGHINERAFSRAVTRTILGEHYNAFAIDVAKEAGVSLFVNLGIPDDRQSEICAEADALPPMTLAEWQRSSVGAPKRHVFNCRCDLLGVLDELATENWSAGGSSARAGAAGRTLEEVSA